LAVQRPGFARDVGGFERRGQVVVDDLEGAGIGVVDADLLGGEPVFDQLVFDPLVGERPGGVEAERLQVAGENFHRRDTACLDRFDELGTGGEGEILAAPQAEPLGIGEIVDRGRAGRGDVEHASIRQGVLEAQARSSLLGGRLIAAFALAAGGVLHGVASSKTMIPSKSEPNQSTIWQTRETFSSRASDRSVA
jgi:hypothetical protein